MIKKKPVKKILAKVRKKKTDFVTTSIAFLPENIARLKASDHCVKRRLSVSWLVNRLVEKLLADEVSVE